jgi:general stress protein YciG
MKNEKQHTLVREFLSRIGKKGGKARAAIYDKATLQNWARKGGRPPGKASRKKTR